MADRTRPGTVVVTGCCGRIGRAVANGLCGRWKVRGFDSSPRPQSLLSDVQLVHGRLEDAVPANNLTIGIITHFRHELLAILS